MLIGSRIGPYEVLAKLGEGGMGEVYRARDTKLGRDVAIKILPDIFSADAERQARFKREAQVLATLNHPNIAGIYGLEESDGTRALVMELVDGPTLADRIAEGRIAVDDALPIARQIAAALEAAHDAGIVHRDLKPANIKVRDDGATKVLDFGLAKLIDPGAAGQSSPNVTASPTITSPAMMTGVGVILGTAAYMSPEQAKGRPADKRSDIWAFGCVLYEMVTGKRAFEGDDVSDTLAAVLRGQPDWTVLPADVPEHIRLLLQRCLEKDRSKRVSDVGIAQFLMTETSLATSQKSAPAPSPLPLPWRKRLVPMVASALIGAAVIGVTAWEWRTQPPAPTVTRFTYRLADDERFTNVGRHALTISPDGMRIAYVANQRIYIKAMWDADAKPLSPQTPGGGVTSPVFSPDGQWIAYWSAPRTLNKLAITGGAPVKLAEVDNPFGMSWAGDSLFVGEGTGGILRIPDKGGSPEVVIRVKEDEVAHGPQLLPDGRSILFTVATGTDQARWDGAQIAVQAIGSADRKTIVRGGADARYLPTGHLVYAVGGVVYATPFDVRRLETSGGPVSIVEGVARSNGTQTGAGQFGVSSTGTLAYLPGSTVTGEAGSSIALLDLKGNVESLKLAPRSYFSPRFSPDGQKLAIEVNDGGNTNIFVYDLDGRTQVRQLTLGGNNRFPIWTSDGAKIAFTSDREGDRSIFWQQSDGKGQAALLVKAKQGETLTPDSWSADGDTLLFTTRTGTRDYFLRAFTLHDKQSRPFADVHSSAQLSAGFSYDGRWVTYSTSVSASDGPGRVFVRPFPVTDEVHTIGPGVSPFWGRDRLNLYFVSSPGVSAFSSVELTTDPVFAASEPKAVPRPPIAGGGPNIPRAYDVAPDGKHLVILTSLNAANSVVAVPQVQVVLNWFEELKSRVPVK